MNQPGPQYARTTVPVWTQFPAGLGGWGGNIPGGKDEEGIIKLYPNVHMYKQIPPETSTLSLTGVCTDYLSTCRHK